MLLTLIDMAYAMGPSPQGGGGQGGAGGLLGSLLPLVLIFVIFYFLLIRPQQTVILAVIFFLPNTPVFQYMPEWWKSTMPDKGIVLGLDLQGGLHLVFEVEGDKAVEITTERYAARLKDLNNPQQDRPVWGFRTDNPPAG